MMLIVLITLALNIGSLRALQCIQRSAEDIRPDPQDCSLFYVCLKGKIYKYRCQNTVFDPSTASCVTKFSLADKCSKRNMNAVSAKMCPPRSKELIPHPNQCAQYYNCSAPSVGGLNWQENLQECKYPQLYNIENQKCEHFSMVECGQRKRPVYECEYKSNQCESSHCIPCHIRFPNCIGLPDGLNTWKGREASPFFAVCLNNRTVYAGRCDDKYGPQLFHGETRRCVDAKDFKI